MQFWTSHVTIVMDVSAHENSMESPVIEAMIGRMSIDKELPISAHFLRSHPENGREETVVQGHLRCLIKDEPGIFLERYGKDLTQEELHIFRDQSGDVT
jgi:hypothetical protein